VGQAGAGYYTATYTETEGDFVTEGRAHAFGWYTAAGLDVALTGGLSLTATGGYQSAVLDNFGVTFFRLGSPPAVLEFTGFIGRAVLSFRF
jgi:hypothetical protein